MRIRRYFKSVLSLLLMLTIILTLYPAKPVAADHDRDHDDDWKSHQKTKDYLVLVGQENGTYIAYKDIAFVTAKDYVMVKAKPIADALGLTYENTSGKYWKKGCTLSLGKKKNVYTKNLRTYYFYNDNKKSTKVAKYKQTVHESYNAVHYATLGTLVNYEYYSSSKAKDYKKLGYQGVVVYNRYSKIKQIPDIKNVINFDDYNPNPNDKATTIKLVPSIFSYQANGTAIFVEANYATPNTSEKIILDLTDVLSAFQTTNLPFDGCMAMEAATRR